MTTFGLPVASLPPTALCGPHIPAAELARLESAADIVAAARDEADRLLAAAREQVAAAGDEARRIVEAGRLEATRAREEAVAQAVRWLVAEQALEQSIARDMAARLRRAAAEWMHAAGCDVASGEALAERLALRLPELARRGALTLTVAPAQFERVRARLEPDDRIDVKADAGLGPAEAWLDSPQLRLCFDLERQWRQTLEALRQEEAP
jgi:vacuolar-type H+-ATPase subunit H